MNLTFLERNQVVIGAVAAAAILAAVIGGLVVQGGIFQGGYTLQAQFANAAGLSAGDHVFVAGVRAGTVDGLELAGDHVLVTFNVDTELPDQTRAKIILRTLVGARAMELVPSGDWERPLGDGDVIPLDRTDVPVDIPEFGEVAEDLLSQTDTAALDEFLKAVTEITRGQRVQVGALIEGGRRLATVVSDQEQQVRRLIRGLRSLGETLQARDAELAVIVDDFGDVVAELAARREELRRFLRATNSASAAAADLVRDERDELDRILSNVHIASDIVARHQLDLAEALAYSGDAITGFASISYSGAQKVPWGYVFTTSLGTVGVDTITGCGGLFDQYLDELLGPDPRSCAEQDNSTFPEDTPNADEDASASLPLSAVARRALPVRDALRLLAGEVAP
ncbi:MAG TPA: MCE family protein [Egibacteraceae bacterium]|nr:MCE family protein [Egibacteraceae bacterium]